MKVTTVTKWDWVKTFFLIAALTAVACTVTKAQTPTKLSVYESKFNLYNPSNSQEYSFPEYTNTTDQFELVNSIYNIVAIYIDSAGLIIPLNNESTTFFYNVGTSGDKDALKIYESYIRYNVLTGKAYLSPYRFNLNCLVISNNTSQKQCFQNFIILRVPQNKGYGKMYFYYTAGL